LVYVDEKTNQDSYIVNKLKHALGFPMMYFANEEKKILNIQKIGSHHSSETLTNSYNIHFDSLSKGVALIIADLDARGVLGEISSTEEEEEEDVEKEKKSKKKKKKKKKKEVDDEGLGDDGLTDEERRIDEEYEKYRREKEASKKKKG